MSKYMYDMQIGIFDGVIQYRKLYREGDKLEDWWTEWEPAYADEKNPQFLMPSFSTKSLKDFPEYESEENAETMLTQCILKLQEVASKQNTYHKQNALLEGIEAIKKLGVP